MVVKSDGSKWACQSCLKGHRVSGCTHTDRELTLVPKKGRPVTQCQHCRQERKKRSAHVKCDCGEAEKPHHPREKCIHLREAEEKLKAGYHEDHYEEREQGQLAAVAEEQGCCCHHGGKCTCSLLKREPSTDGDVTPPHGPVVKPRLEPTKSEGSITVFQNGHHKPVHRKNHAAHECGMPYKMPMARSNTDTGVAKAARRSVDSLALDHSMSLSPSEFMPQTSAPFNTERRLSKSEQPSPKLDAADRVFKGCPLMGSTRLLDFDLRSLAPTQTNQSLTSASSDAFGYPCYDPMSGVDGSFDPWSAAPSADNLNMPNNNPFGVWPTTNDTSSMAQPALTAASSGTQSEIDEIPPMDETYGFGMPSIQEDIGGFNINDFIGSTSPQSNRRSLPPNFLSSVFKPSDYMMAGVDGNEWQSSSVDFTNVVDGKPKQFDDDSQPLSDNNWQIPSDIAPTNLPQRFVGGLPTTGRPTSHSVGHTSAPNDEIIQQLFPGIDVNGSLFGTSSSPQDFTTTDKSIPSSTNVTSAPIDFGGPMDNENAGFTSQPWSDGSMSVPNDPYNSYDDLNQEFSNPDFTANWTQ